MNLEVSNCQFFLMFGFECVAKDIEGWLLFCTSCLVYSQLWLNVSENDCHFWLQTKILKQNTLHAPPLFDLPIHPLHYTPNSNRRHLSIIASLMCTCHV
jgi:hypothetical protein